MTHNGASQVVLVILDGWGHREEQHHNAIAQAHTPFFDTLWNEYPHTVINASEEWVGLPAGQMGNSEIGHMTIGSGTTIDTDIVRISKAVSQGEFVTNAALRTLFEHVKKNNSTLHVKGLVSPGGVHSHYHHLFAFLKACKSEGITKIAVHAVTDGRDTSPQSGADYLKELEDVLDDLGIGHIATASGRFFAMDRDTNWDRVAKAEAALFSCQGSVCTSRKPSEVVRELYAKGVVDEHLEPLVFLDDTGAGYPIAEHDGVFFFNFRADRARQISKRIIEQTRDNDVCFVTMTEYEANMDCLVAFPPQKIKTTLADEVSRAGMTQAHIAETEKYAHVTYFFNGGSEVKHTGEEWVLIESRKDVPTHDLAPEMRAKEIADAAVARLDTGTDFICINFANADMVGHTAKVDAIVTALEVLDTQLRRVVEKAWERGAHVFISADHGNAEQNMDEAGTPHTAHTLNVVPGILTTKGYALRPSGTLADIAPTILELLGLPQPEEMTGSSLLH